MKLDEVRRILTNSKRADWHESKDSPLTGTTSLRSVMVSLSRVTTRPRPTARMCG